MIIDDGSRDETFARLQALCKQLPYLTALHKNNEGHGPTLQFGYQYALEHGADYVFQTDSDGQTLPEEFPSFWQARDEYAAIIGNRTARQDGFGRFVVTKTLKLILLLIFGVVVPDANTPYRLMQSGPLRRNLAKIPEKFNLTNVMLTVLLLKSGEKVRFIPITFRPRQGGVNSINLPKIGKIGVKAIRDFAAIKHAMRQGENG